MITRNTKGTNPFKGKLLLATVFLAPIILGASILAYNKLDTLQRTEITLGAKIISIETIHPRRGGGKSGASILHFDSEFSSYNKIKVISIDGSKYSFNKPLTFPCNLDTKIALRLYKRNITKIKKYKLEKRS